MTPEELQQQVRDLTKRVELQGLFPSGMLARLTAGEVVAPQGEEIDLHIKIASGLVRAPNGFVGVVTVAVRAQRKLAKRPFAKFVSRERALRRRRRRGRRGARGLRADQRARPRVAVCASLGADGLFVHGDGAVALAVDRVQAPNAVKLEAEPKQRPR